MHLSIYIYIQAWSSIVYELVPNIDKLEAQLGTYLPMYIHIYLYIKAIACYIKQNITKHIHGQFHLQSNL